MTSPTQSAMEQQQREELLPCPFCGGQARCVDLAGWEIHCDCGAQLWRARPDKEALVAHWNGRVDASELRSLRDSLALARSRIAELEGGPKATPTDAQIRVFAEEMGMWVEPHEAERESGVEVECSISPEDAERLNAEFIATIREAWARAFGAPLSARAALNKEQP